MLKALLFISVSLGLHLLLSWGPPFSTPSAVALAEEKPVVVQVPQLQRALPVYQSQAPAVVAPKPPAIEPPRPTVAEKTPVVTKPAVVKPTVAKAVPSKKTPAKAKPEPINRQPVQPSVQPPTPVVSAPKTTVSNKPAVTQAAATSAAVNTTATAPAKPAAKEVFSRQPRFKNPPKPPTYPAAAKRKNQQGQVLLEVRLDAAGRQQGLQIVKSSGISSLDQAALTAVKNWQFIPETVNGLPVASRVEVPVNFTLNQRR